MNNNSEAYEIGRIRRFIAVVRLLIGGVHPGFWKLVRESRKFRLNVPAHSNRIMTYGIDSRTDLVFIAENIAKSELQEDISSQSAMNLLNAFETVLNLNIKNIEWFIEGLSFQFPDFDDLNISLDPEIKHPARVYEVFLRKKMKTAFIELREKPALKKEIFMDMAESFLYLVLTARFELNCTTRGKLKDQLRIWM